MTKLTAVISYGAGLAGVGITLYGLLPALTGYMNYREARAMILNLLRTQPMRAEPVARASPGTFYEPLAAAIKMGAEVGGKDPAVIATATRPTYDATAQMVSANAKKLIGRAKLGAGAAGGAAALAYSKGTVSIFLIVLAAACAAGLITLFWYKSDVERNIVLARHEVLPEVDTTIAAGKIWKA